MGWLYLYSWDTKKIWRGVNSPCYPGTRILKTSFALMWAEGLQRWPRRLISKLICLTIRWAYANQVHLENIHRFLAFCWYISEMVSQRYDQHCGWHDIYGTSGGKAWMRPTVVITVASTSNSCTLRDCWFVAVLKIWYLHEGARIRCLGVHTCPSH